MKNPDVDRGYAWVVLACKSSNIHLYNYKLPKLQILYCILPMILQTLAVLEMKI